MSRLIEAWSALGVNSLSGFFPKALEFLHQIQQNNNKEWFEANRSDYEKLILNPSKDFVLEMGEHLMALDPQVKYIPKINKSLFKIFRDTRRMGANREPIKSKIGIIFPVTTYDDRIQQPSFYLHFSPDELFVAVGVRWFYAPMLNAYRKYILNDNNRSDLMGVINTIRSDGYKIVEKELVRYPKGFDSSMENCELSLYKGVASYVSLDPNLINSNRLIDTLFNHYKAMQPLLEITKKIALLKSL